jgi:hypothetical protein
LKELPGRLLPPQAKTWGLPPPNLNSLLPTLTPDFHQATHLIYNQALKLLKSLTTFTTSSAKLQATRLEGDDFFSAPQQIYHTDLRFATAFAIFRHLLVALLSAGFALDVSKLTS